MTDQLEPRILYLSDSDNPDFDERRKLINIACVGDSITGWNNIRFEMLGPSGVGQEIYPTYPEFLQELAKKRFFVVDCGIAGAISREGLVYVKNALQKFPNARYFVLGFGTNDLAEGYPIESVSNNILNNYSIMIDNVLKNSKQPVLFNVSQLNSTAFNERVVEDGRKKIKYYNQRLEEYCKSRNIPLADIYPVLKDEHFADAIHPNEEGARLIAQEVYKTINLVNDRVFR